MMEITDVSYNEAIRRIKKLGEILPPKEMRKILTAGSKIYSQAAKLKAPVYQGKSGVHHRYNTSKLSNRLRAPKGMGNIVATYHAGNLKRSIKKLAARKLIRAVMIGPKRAKNGGKNTFKGNRVDGYYAGMIEGGTKNMSANPFFEESWKGTRGAVIKKIERDLANLIISKAQTL